MPTVAAMPMGSRSIIDHNYMNSGMNNGGGSIPIPEDAWYYSDKSGKTQGPFSTERMRKWWLRGKLSAELWVKPAPNAGFPLILENKGYVPIRQLYADDLERAFGG